MGYKEKGRVIGDIGRSLRAWISGIKRRIHREEDEQRHRNKQTFLISKAAKMAKSLRAGEEEFKVSVRKVFLITVDYA